MFRFRVLRELVLRPDGDLGHERLPDRHQETESAAETVEGRLQTLLKP